MCTRADRSALLRGAFLAAAMLSSAACTEEVLLIIDVDSVEVSGPPGSVQVGATAQFTATPKDDRGNELANRQVTWQTSNGTLASIDANGLLRALASGTVTVTATIEGVEGSNSLTIDLPAPSISSINPTSAAIGANGFTLVVDGSNFAPNSVVRWNGLNRTTTFVSATRVQASIAAADVAEPGLFNVTVFTPAPGGGSSTAQTFTVRIVGAPPFVDMGGYFACAVATAAQVYCWGQNPVGQLGDGTTTNRSVPTRVQSALSFVSVTTGAAHACALTNYGAAYCWGVNNGGQLADGTNVSRSSPVAVTGGLFFVAISAGSDHTCALTAQGRVYCWGVGSFGRLGDGTTSNRGAPTLVQGNLAFRSLSAGVLHTCGVTTANELYCWGGNQFGQLGLGDNNSRNTPQRVATPVSITAVSAAEYHTCAIGTNGFSYCSGDNGTGQLGTGNFTDSLVPVQSGGAGGFVSISANTFHTCAIQGGGSMLCWGYNFYGELGIGNTDFRNTPTLVTGGTSFKAVGTGLFGTCGLGTTGLAYCWGSRVHGQMGDGQTAHRLTPVPVLGGPSAFSTISIGKTFGYGFACGLSTTGAAFCWGDNGGGQLGTGNLNNALSPTPVSGGPGTFAEISTGNAHVCARTAAGTAYCWGIGFNGQLGIGSFNVSRNTPTQVAGSNLFQSISAGLAHTCGVTTAGQIFCWGENSSGQLGNGVFTDASSPTPVTGVAGLVFVQVSAGAFHTCARTNSRAIYCWGDNRNSQVGDGTTTNRTQPVLLNVGNDFAFISAGADHTCATRTSGAAACWGFGLTGELGDGTAQNRSTPTAVAGGLTFVQVVAGAYSTCGITTNAAAHCWGGYEEINGTGTSVNSNMPTVAVSGGNYTSISPNAYYVCGVAAGGGGGRCWGFNSVGELGIGLSGIVYSPTAVQGGITFTPPPSERITRRR
jgi:alpha-tubulin suppressor-like RCC1 family protein